MKGKSYVTLQCFLWFIALFHLLVGAGLNLFPGFARTMADAYGATVDWDQNQFTYIIKPLGAFMFALGTMAVAAALAPTRYRPIIYGFAVLFLCRALQRIVFADEILNTFNIESTRNLLNAGFFTAMGVGLIVLERMTCSADGASAETA